MMVDVVTERQFATVHEHRARLAKACALAGALRRLHVPADTVRTYDDGAWRMIAAAADVNPPSEATRELVRDLLEATERHPPPDALEAI